MECAAHANARVPNEAGSALVDVNAYGHSDAAKALLVRAGWLQPTRIDSSTSPANGTDM